MDDPPFNCPADSVSYFTRTYVKIKTEFALLAQNGKIGYTVA
jgi:hypothetical protein